MYMFCGIGTFQGRQEKAVRRVVQRVLYKARCYGNVSFDLEYPGRRLVATFRPLSNRERRRVFGVMPELDAKLDRVFKAARCGWRAVKGYRVM